MTEHVKTYEISFTANVGYEIPVSEDAEEFIKEWIADSYPEFYDVVITETKELNK